MSDDRVALLTEAYRLFNDRAIDALLAMMTDDVEWPDVAGSKVLHGKQAVRAYWEAQFAVASPKVTPTDFVGSTDGDDVVAVIDQQVFDLEGRPLTPLAVVYHRYSFSGSLVRRMTVFDDSSAAVGSPPIT
jgi:ketosteroid isomerase-like protein